MWAYSIKAPYYNHYTGSKQEYVVTYHFVILVAIETNNVKTLILNLQIIVPVILTLKFGSIPLSNSWSSDALLLV